MVRLFLSLAIASVIPLSGCTIQRQMESEIATPPTPISGSGGKRGILLDNPHAAQIRCDARSLEYGLRLNCTTFVSINDDLVLPDKIDENLELHWRIFDDSHNEIFPACTDEDGSLECDFRTPPSDLLVQLDIRDRESNETASPFQQVPSQPIEPEPEPELPRSPIHNVIIDEVFTSKVEIELTISPDYVPTQVSIRGVLVGEGNARPTCQAGRGVSLTLEGNAFEWDPLNVPKNGISRAYFCVFDGTNWAYTEKFVKLKYLGGGKKAEATVMDPNSP